MAKRETTVAVTATAEEWEQVYAALSMLHENRLPMGLLLKVRRARGEVHEVAAAYGEACQPVLEDMLGQDGRRGILRTHPRYAEFLERTSDIRLSEHELTLPSFTLSELRRVEPPITLPGVALDILQRNGILFDDGLN